MPKKPTMASRGRKSKQKGKCGEREFAHFLQDNFEIQAARGVQYQGGQGSPDVVIGELGKHLHFEVKRTEKLNLWPSLNQALGDASKEQVPIVAHRPSRKPWIVIMLAKDLARFAQYFHTRNDTKDEIGEPPEKKVGVCSEESFY